MQINVIGNEIAFWSELSEFRFVKEEWNGPGSVRPSKQVIEVALEFILNWPVEGIVPEPELYSNGAISWQFYDEAGYTIGGVEFHDNDVGVFLIVNQKAGNRFRVALNQTQYTNYLGL